ncbi:MAG: hypothetical protein EHM36_04725 [Deltaproteobacteria bacterium]|nr:MAG: hypothetical protein EHM36_04725 [Deltaproteobacteria bacterium]
MKKKEMKRLCTGMTVSDLRKDIRTLEKGKKAPKKCYLCKRREGDKSVLLTPDEKKPYALPKITLVPVQRRVTEDWVFDYFLCWECALLVGLHAKPIGQKRRPQSEKLPAQFLPAGPAKGYYS